MCKRIIFLLLTSLLFSEVPLENLSIADAEQIALEYNKNFQIAEQNTNSAEERKKQAISKWLPAISYRAEVRAIDKPALYFDIFSPILTFGNQGYSSILQLAQPIFSSDLLFGLKQSNYEAEAFTYRQAQTQNELLRALRDHYYLVVFLENELSIERENIDYLAYALEQEQGKLDSGSSTPFEVNQSKAALANAISLYYNTLKKLKEGRNALILTMGIDPIFEPKMQLNQKDIPIDSIPFLKEKLDQIDITYRYTDKKIPSTKDFLSSISRLETARKLTLFSNDELQNYLDLAFCHRPDLLVQKTGVEVADQQVNLKVGTYLPKVSGYVHYSYNDVDLGTKPFFDEAYHWSAGVVLSWNIFDSMLREHEVKEAKAQRQAQKIRLAKQWQQIEVEIRNGLYQLEEAMLTYLSACQGSFVAEQASFQAREKLAYGRISPLDYRDAVNQLLQAKNMQNLASYELIAAYYEIRYATGVDTD